MRCVTLSSAVGIALTAMALAGPAAGASAAPGNDAFVDAVPVRVGSSVNGDVNGATSETGEPRHGESGARHSVWYRFRASRKVTVLLSTCVSDFDTVVAVYSGGDLALLRTVDFNDDGCSRDTTGSRVSFTARPGRTYHIAVAGSSPAGSFTLKVTRINVPPNDDFVDARRIRLGNSMAGTTRNATRELHEPRHDGKKADLTVWYRLRVARRTRVELNTIGSRFDTVLAVYTGSRVDRLRRVASNDDIHCCSNLDSRVRFTAKPGVTYRIAVAEYGHHANGPIRLNAVRL
jgi:hypothetical protein